MYNNRVVARLKPGVSLGKARAELDRLVTTLAARYPPILARTTHQLTLPMWPFADEIVGRSRRMILVLMAPLGSCSSSASQANDTTGAAVHKLA